jgi:5-oxoprolinase (ATP-hydrolysing) subunit C
VDVAQRATGRLVITVVDPGPLSSIQDPGGRPGWRRYGVPVGGAADAWSARLANLLVGNREDRALIEVTLGGATFALDAPAVVAVCGGVTAAVEGLPLPLAEARPVRPGSMISLGVGEGARGYIALGGGIEVRAVLGGLGTDLRSGFGGHEGRALRAGDRLEIRTAASDRHMRWTGRGATGPIRLVSGPQPDALAPLVGADWTVGAEADRAGVRLDGAALIGGETASMGLPLGAIQVPPDGRPIVMLVDRPVTGGYVVPACVIGADIGRVAQLRTGDVLRFEAVSLEDAALAWNEAEEALRALEPADPGDDEPLRWIGAHG